MKALRVRGDGVRRVYTAARRVERFLRDAPRREAMRNLPATPLTVPADQGFLIVPAGRFCETDAVVGDARAALARYDATVPVSGKNRKRFLVNVVDASVLTLESGALRLALREDVLSTISRYLGVVPFLTAVSVFHSDAVDGDFTSSQLHHCDGDDITQIKIFVHCSDVDARSGPLTLLDATSSARVRRATRYQYRQRLTDAQVQSALGEPRDVPILGGAGTTVFVDTSRCFHYGSRVALDAPPRLVTMIQYQTPYSFMLPSSAQASLPFRRLLRDSLSPLQRLVLGE